MEIYLNGEWLAVCGYAWDPLDAAVACRQLGFAEALKTYTSSSHNDFEFSWKRGLKCKGNETKLMDCQQDIDPDIMYLCGHRSVHRYSSVRAVAGVVCKNDSRQALPKGIFS